MADVELVIKISEEIVNEIKDNAMFAGSISSDIRWDVTNAIVNGTPLPKGHGRLIDADSLKEAEQKWSCDYEQDGFSHVVEISDIDEEPTIIEADKAERSDKE